MSTRHDNADGPEDIDAAFAEIVAGLERDTPMSRWPDQDTGNQPDEPTRSDPEIREETEEPAPEPAPSVGPRDWTPEPEDEGHFEPPEPPPLPTPRLGTLGGVALIGLGLCVLLVPGLAGMGTALTLPLGLVAISAGIGWLLFRMRQGGSPDDPTDDGAQV